MDYIITHYPDKKRFETQVDGVVAFVQYRLSGDKPVSYTHLRAHET
mgnify:CR=1 FL=1